MKVWLYDLVILKSEYNSAILSHSSLYANRFLETEYLGSKTGSFLLITTLFISFVNITLSSILFFRVSLSRTNWLPSII